MLYIIIIIIIIIIIFALFVLNTKESWNQYCASHYGSTFEAVFHLRHNRPTLVFSQYLSRPHGAMHLPSYYSVVLSLSVNLGIAVCNAAALGDNRIMMPITIYQALY